MKHCFMRKVLVNVHIDKEDNDALIDLVNKTYLETKAQAHRRALHEGIEVLQNEK